MGEKRGLQILGWLSLVAGYGLVLALIRGIFVGTTGGFGTRPSQVVWVLFGYLLYFALALYLFVLGRRTLAASRGNFLQRMRFGWFRILLGSIVLYSFVVNKYQSIPVRRIKSLEPANETQSAAAQVTTIIIVVVCVLSILSGIWRGFRLRRTTASPGLQ